MEFGWCGWPGEDGQIVVAKIQTLQVSQSGQLQSGQTAVCDPDLWRERSDTLVWSQLFYLSQLVRLDCQAGEEGLQAEVPGKVRVVDVDLADVHTRLH